MNDTFTDRIKLFRRGKRFIYNFKLFYSIKNTIPNKVLF